MRNLYLDALNGKSVSRNPIWIMRQAGRYLPEYMKIRSSFKGFMSMCRNANACCEVALQPLDRYDLDAAIVFSDILTIPEAMGMSLEFIPNKGPVFLNKIENQNDVNGLITKDIMDRLDYVFNAVKLTKNATKDRVPLIGFSGSPWTLAAYMVEGSASKQFNLLRKMMYSQPKLMHELLNKIKIVTIEYLKLQIKAGADSIMLFDSWGGLLSFGGYNEFSLKYMDEIIIAVKKDYPNVPFTIFTKGGGQWLEMISKTNCNAIGIDWTVDTSKAIKDIGSCKVQGNLDPAALYGNKEMIKSLSHKVLKSFGGDASHIFNLGHGIYPDTNPDNVKMLIDAVRNY